MKIFEVNQYNPQERLLKQVVDILKKDGVIIYPSDSSYTFGCSIQSKKAMKRIYQIKEIDKKRPLTFICDDTKRFQNYTKGITTPIFKTIRGHIPGPYTFIFEGSKLVPKTMLCPRSTIGVRVPDSLIACQLVELLDEPILSSSVPIEEEEIYQDGLDLFQKYQKVVDAVVNCGDMFVQKSAMIDFSSEPPEVLRSGDADISWLDIN